MIPLTESPFCIFKTLYYRFLLTFATSKKSLRMHSKLLQSSPTFRFRRWSRVGYAVFCSLACSVTIGALAVSVSDKTLQKQVGSTSNGLYAESLTTNFNDSTTEKIELEAVLQLIQETTFIISTTDNTTACSQFIYYNINCNG